MQKTPAIPLLPLRSVGRVLKEEKDDKKRDLQRSKLLQFIRRHFVR